MPQERRAATRRQRAARRGGVSAGHAVRAAATVVRRRSPELGRRRLRPRSPLTRLKIFRFGAEVQNRPDRFRSALEVPRTRARSRAERADGGSGAAGAHQTRRIWTRRILWMTLPQLVELVVVSVMPWLWRTTSTSGTRRPMSLGIVTVRAGRLRHVRELGAGRVPPARGHGQRGQLWDASRMAWSVDAGPHGARREFGVESRFAASLFFLPSRRWRRRGVDRRGAGPGARLLENTPSTRRRRTYAQVPRCVNSGSRDALVLQHARAGTTSDGHSSRPPAGGLRPVVVRRRRRWPRAATRYLCAGTARAVGPGAADECARRGPSAPAPGSFPASFFSSFVELRLPPDGAAVGASPRRRPSLAPAPAAAGPRGRRSAGPVRGARARRPAAARRRRAGTAAAPVTHAS